MMSPTAQNSPRPGRDRRAIRSSAHEAFLNGIEPLARRADALERLEERLARLLPRRRSKA